MNKAGSVNVTNERSVMKWKKHRNPTVNDVAKLAGVGLMTVSRVLNGQPVVRPSTRKRVLAAIKQLGYKRNEAARMLKGLPTMMIGLIVPDLSDSFFATCAQTVQHIARSHGFMTLVAASEGDSELEIEQAQLMASRNLSGMVIATSTVGGDSRLKELQNSGLTIVAIDRPIDGLQADSVDAENRRGAEEATRHLIEHGHKNIAFLGYHGEIRPAIERVEGYADALRAAGLKTNIYLDLWTGEDVQKWASTIRGHKDRPTAVLTANHVISYRVLHTLRKAGLSIPGDVALIGFHDFELASDFTPPLTVVEISPEDMTKRAMALLIDRINRKRTQEELPPAKVVMPTKLILRSSCGCKTQSENS